MWNSENKHLEGGMFTKPSACLLKIGTRTVDDWAGLIIQVADDFSGLGWLSQPDSQRLCVG